MFTMGLIQINQKAKIIFDSEGHKVELDYTVDDVLFDRIRLVFTKSFMRYLDYLEAGNELLIKVFAPQGVIQFHSMVISSPLEKFFEIEYDEDAINLEMDYSSKIDHLDNLIIKRPLLGDISTKIINMDLSWLSFCTVTPLNINSTFDFIMTLDNEEIMFKGKIIGEIDENCFKVQIIEMTKHDKGIYYSFLEKLKGQN